MNIPIRSQISDSSPEFTEKLRAPCGEPGVLTLSVEYDAVVMRPEVCMGRWDRYPPLSLA
jgi:hypothetical protein